MISSTLRINSKFSKVLSPTLNPTNSILKSPILYSANSKLCYSTHNTSNETTTTTKNLNNIDLKENNKESKDNNNDNNNNNNNQNNKKKGFSISKSLLIITATAAIGSYVYFKANGVEPKVEYLKRIPFRVTSNLWGKLANIQIPEGMRGPIYKTYSNLFGVNIEEAEKPIEEYTCMGDFFARRLKPMSREIDQKSDMVSPVDGTVIYHGRVNNDSLEQVKGLTYTLEQFLGPEELKNIKGKNLYHIGIYLSPGDYHGIHSPIDWQIKNRYHFPGYLFPVAKIAVDNIPGLFAMNERVVLAGSWKYGYYSLTPVGASNVGSIVLDFDKELRTNDQLDQYKKNTYFKKQYPSTINSERGSEVAFFRMGSTVILIFEVPENKKFDFNIIPGQHVRLGQSMGNLENNK